MAPILCTEYGCGRSGRADALKRNFEFGISNFEMESPTAGVPESGQSEIRNPRFSLGLDVQLSRAISVETSSGYPAALRKQGIDVI